MQESGNLKDGDRLTTWFDGAAQRAWNRALANAKQRVSEFAHVLMALDRGNSSCCLLEYVYTQVKLHCGIFCPNGDAIVQLVDVGIVRLAELESVIAGVTTGKVKIADPMFEHGLESVTMKRPTTVVCMLDVLMTRAMA